MSTSRYIQVHLIAAIMGAFFFSCVPKRDLEADAGTLEPNPSSSGGGQGVAVDAGSDAGSDAGTDGGTSKEFTLDELPEKLSGPLCELTKRCIGETNFETLAAKDGTLENCSKLVVSDLRSIWLPPLKNAVAQGTLEFQPSQLEAQIEYFETVACEDPNFDYLMDFSKLFTGKVQDGAACSLRAECQTESYCRFGGQCPGTCTPRMTVDSQAECEFGEDSCERGAFCPAGGSQGGAACKMMKSPGELCKNASDKCSGAFICVGSCISFEDLATFYPEEGVACEDANFLMPCAKGLSCVKISEAETVCQKKAEALQPCGFSKDDDSCVAGYFCDFSAQDGGLTSGICRARGELNDSCVENTPFALSGSCRFDLRCSSKTLTCVELRRNGEACDTFADCESKNCQNGLCAVFAACTP